MAQPPEKEKNSSKSDTAAGIEQIVDLLQQKGVISRDEAQALKSRGDNAGASKSDGAQDAFSGGAGKTDRNEAGKVRGDLEQLEEKVDRQLDNVQTNTRINKREIERLESERIDQLAEQNRKSSWAERISFNGDIRLRYEGIYFDENNAPQLAPDDPTTYLNTTIDRERYRARVRLGLKAVILDPREVNVGKVKAEVRLTTGTTSDPVSTNETLGDYFNKDSVVFDRYYIDWTYKPTLPVWGRIPQVSLTGGRMPRPWFTSDLIWDDDVNVEGFTLNFKTDTLDANNWHVFMIAGAYPLQELEKSSGDKWLYAGQLGFAARPFYGLNLKVGAGYYDYKNITAEPDASGLPGEVSPGVPNDSPPLFQQWGNTVVFIDDAQTKAALVSDFDILDITTEIDLDYFFPVHVILSGTYAKNLGFDQDEVSRRLGGVEIPEETEAYRVGLKVGYPKIYNFGEWNLFYIYKNIERDSVLDAFNDSDFHLGGTNARGWTAGLKFGLYHNMWLRTRWITTDVVTGSQYAADTFQFDINVRF